MEKYDAIVLAAGVGRRMEATKNKVLLTLDDGRTIIEHTVMAFLEDSQCARIALVVQADDHSEITDIIANVEGNENIMLVIGGRERQDSVKIGLQELQNGANIVMVHDGARPFIQKETLERVFEKTRETGAAIVGVPVKDTIKRVIEGAVVETVERAFLCQAQTPQAFRLELLKAAHKYAEEVAFLGTDEASLVEQLGITVHVVKGSYQNIKITTPEDMVLAQAILKQLKEER